MQTSRTLPLSLACLDGCHAVEESKLTWDTIANQPFVDVAQSPPLARAFFIPGWSPRHNHYLQYVLLKQLRR
jgi:hypothetical protein